MDQNPWKDMMGCLAYAVLEACLTIAAFVSLLYGRTDIVAVVLVVAAVWIVIEMRRWIKRRRSS